MTQQGSPSQSVERDGMVASRRAVLAGGLALAAAACTPASNTPPSNTAAPTAAGQSPGSLQEVSGHALYSLPQDHKWHTGGIFDSGQIPGKVFGVPVGRRAAGCPPVLVDGGRGGGSGDARGFARGIGSGGVGVAAPGGAVVGVGRPGQESVEGRAGGWCAAGLGAWSR